MTNKQALLKELEKIFEHTTQQTIFHKRSNEYLYKGLAWVYLWWVSGERRRANSVLQDNTCRIHNQRTNLHC